MAEAVIGALRVVLGADSAAFEKQMNDLSSKLDGIGKSLQNVGGIMSAAITAPLTALGVKAVQAFGDSEKAIAAVDAALKSMGGKAGYSSEQLQKMAADLQKVSTFDDDEILSKVTANLLTFGNISGEVFAGAQQAALDLSARLGTDLQSSTLMLGKALNDPIKGLTALTRAGVSFTAEQKEMIKSMVESGNLLGAQNLMLNEIMKQFGGQAAAQANTVMGAWAQMQNAIGDALEAIGKVIAPYVVTFANFVKGLAEAFTALDPRIQTAVVAFAAVAAAIGPVLIGIGLMLPALGLIGTALAAIVSPVGLFVAALAIVSITLNEFGITFEQQWAAVKISMGGVVEFFRTQVSLLSNLFSGEWGAAWQDFLRLVQIPMETVSRIVETLFPGLIDYLRKKVEEVKKFFTDMVTSIQNAFTTLKTAAGEILTAITKAVTEALAALWKGIQDAATGIIEQLTSLKDDAIAAVMNLYNGMKQWLVDGIDAIFQPILDRIAAVKAAFADLYNAVVGNSYVPDMVSESLDQFKMLASGMDKFSMDGMKAVNDNMAKVGGEIEGFTMKEAPSVASPQSAPGGGMGSGNVVVIQNIQTPNVQSFYQARKQIAADAGRGMGR